ncbi:Synaptotagmin-14, partial [Varanus komodoensis]
MAFFKHFQQNLSLPSMSSFVDTLSNAVDDLTSAVGDVSYTVADSVTEQVTSMINSLRTDDTVTIQDDKCVVGKEKNRPQLNHDKELDVRGKGYNAEEKNKHIDFSKQCKNDGREFNYNKDQIQYQPNTSETNEPFHEAEVCEAVNNSVKDTKKRRPGSDYLEKVTFPKDFRQDCNISGQKQSLNKESHTLFEQSKDHLHKRVKQIPSGVDLKNTKKVYGVASRNLEAKEEETPKLPESSSKQVHGVHEVKGETCKTFSDGHRQSVTKQEENVPSTLSKESEKRKIKKSEGFSKEVSSKKIPEKDNSYINKDQHGSSSESEDEALGKYHEALSRTQSSRPSAGDSRQQKNYIWETRQKYSPLSAEYDGYSSEASIDE